MESICSKGRLYFVSVEAELRSPNHVREVEFGMAIEMKHISTLLC
jgi:hypothetical protein